MMMCEAYVSFARRWMWCGIVMLLSTMAAFGQPSLNLRRTVVNWHTIELYLTVECQGREVVSMNRSDFEVYEDGDRITNFTYCAPDSSGKYRVSAGMVFDCGPDMIGVPIQSSMQCALNLIKSLDGVMDEAFVIRTGDQILLLQSFTSSRTMLNQAVYGLWAGNGISSTWDAVYDGLLEIKGAGSNPARSLVLFGSGLDHISSHSVSDVIEVAKANNVRIFTVYFGDTAGAANMIELADSTGGKWYHDPDSAAVVSMFNEMVHPFQQFNECLITYQAGCEDGSTRVVDLTLKDFCGGSDTKTSTYTAPNYPGSRSSLSIEIGKWEVLSGREITLPINMQYKMDSSDGYLYPMTAVIRVMDPAPGTIFVGFDTPPGTFLEGVPVNVTTAGDSIIIQTSMRKRFNGVRQLGTITLRAGSCLDTAICEVRFTKVSFTRGCYRAETMSGEVLIIPTKPVLECQMTVPAAVVWDTTAGTYVPNPMIVSMKVVNSGDADALSPKFRIVYDTADYSLMNPVSDKQVPSPSIVAAYGGSSEAQWSMWIKPHASAVASTVSIVATFGNHPDVVCDAAVDIPSTGPVSAVETVPNTAVPTLITGLYPEPNYGEFTVVVRAFRPRSVDMCLMDVLGRRVATFPSIQVNGEIRRRIDLRDVAPGVYFLYVGTADGADMRMITRR